jgi:hypothetical protein
MLTPVLIALALTCAAPPACTCVPVPRPLSRAAAAAYVRTSAAVFEGRVVRVEFEQDSAPPAAPAGTTGRSFRWTDVVATVAVARRWRGDLADTVRVRTAAQTSACGADLVEGRGYLFFASSRGYSGLGEDPPATSATVLVTSKCGLTRGWDPEARRLVRLLAPAGGPASRPQA